VNGVADELHLDAQPGETVRLRIINAVVPAMDGGPEAPVLLGAPFKVISLDGHDLNAPSDLRSARIQLGMGQCADLEFTMPATGGVRLVDSEIAGETSAVQDLLFAAPKPRLPMVTFGDGAYTSIEVDTLSLLDALHYGAPAPDPIAAAIADVTEPVVLSNQPGIRDGTLKLVPLINGQASPDVAPIVVSEGDVVRPHRQRHGGVSPDASARSRLVGPGG